MLTGRKSRRQKVVELGKVPRMCILGACRLPHLPNVLEGGRGLRGIGTTGELPAAVHFLELSSAD